MKSSPDQPGSVGAILALPLSQRKSLINTLTADMKKKAAPTDFIEAIACLQDNEVAQKVREALELSSSCQKHQPETAPVLLSKK